MPEEEVADEDEFGEEAAEETRWAERDFFGILWLFPSVTTVQIRKSCVKVALHCHPRKVAPDDKSETACCFQLVAEAYEVLSNEGKRQIYDRIR